MDTRLTQTDRRVLAVLGEDGAYNRLQVVGLLRERQWLTGFGAALLSLNRLQKQGLIERVWRPATLENGWQARECYRLTSAEANASTGASDPTRFEKFVLKLLPYLF